VHELSVAGAIVDTVGRHADGRPVKVVVVRVGRLRQVVPDSLRFYWGIVSEGTLCEGSELRLDEIEARLRCSACGKEWEPLFPDFRCADCGSSEVVVSAGEELEVDYIEVEEPEAVTAG
jgi:hydrogenase nickel incorporation protein HypA/HybF